MSGPLPAVLRGGSCFAPHSLSLHGLVFPVRTTPIAQRCCPKLRTCAQAEHAIQDPTLVDIRLMRDFSGQRPVDVALSFGYERLAVLLDPSQPIELLTSHVGRGVQMLHADPDPEPSLILLNSDSNSSSVCMLALSLLRAKF